MKKYQSINNEIRYYPTLGVVVEPKQTIEIAEVIDAHGLELIEGKGIKAPAVVVEEEGVIANG